MASANFQYDVCLSFAGEDREYVEAVASGLHKQGIRVFYDRYARVELWGKDLYEHLDFVYGKAARYCVLFASEAYARKVWTSHERKSAQDRAINENNEYILPVRFDDTEIPGLRGTVGHIDLRNTAPRELVDLIVQKLDSGQARDTPNPASHDPLAAAPEGIVAEDAPKNTLGGPTSLSWIASLAAVSRLPAVLSVAAVSRLPTVPSVATVLRVAAALAATGIVIAILAAGSPHASASTLRSHNLALRVTAGWRPQGPSIAGLQLSGKPIAVADGDTTIDAGTLSRTAKIPASLPPSLVEEYGKPAQAGIAALPLGTVKSYTWPSTPRGVLSLLIVVTDRGEIAIACRGRATARLTAMQSVCAAVRTQATIIGAGVEYPGPDPHLAAQLALTLAIRTRALHTASALLHSERLPSRAAGLRDMAAADKQVASALGASSAPPYDAAPLASLRRGLELEAGLTQQLSATARGESVHLYESLRARLMAHPAGAAADALMAVGFTKLALPPIEIPRAPARSHSHVFADSQAGQSTPSASPSQPIYARPVYTAPVASRPAPAPHPRSETITSKPE